MFNKLIIFLWKIILYLIKSIMAACIGFAVIFFYGRYVEPNLILVTEKPIYIKDLPTAFEGKRIVQISDLHGKKYLYGNPLVQRVNNLEADFIVITGDIWDGRYPNLAYADRIITPLKAKEGKFFVLGNNEYSLKINDVVSKLESQGVTILRNRSIPLTKGSDRLWLIGVDDPHLRKDNLPKALLGVGAGPRILLAHSPEILPKAREAGIDLVLTGHTHGG